MGEGRKESGATLEEVGGEGRTGESIFPIADACPPSLPSWCSSWVDVTSSLRPSQWKPRTKNPPSATPFSSSSLREQTRWQSFTSSPKERASAIRCKHWLTNAGGGA